MKKICTPLSSLKTNCPSWGDMRGVVTAEPLLPGARWESEAPVEDRRGGAVGGGRSMEGVRSVGGREG